MKLSKNKFKHKVKKKEESKFMYSNAKENGNTTYQKHMGSSKSCDEEEVSL